VVKDNNAFFERESKSLVIIYNILPERSIESIAIAGVGTVLHDQRCISEERCMIVVLIRRSMKHRYRRISNMILNVLQRYNIRDNQIKRK
jgi:hypothetical protein